MDVAVLVKGRFEPIPDAVTRSVGANAWEIDIPLDPARCKRLRRGAKAEDWDGAVFLLDEVESQPAVGSGESPSGVRVSVFVL